MNEEQASMLIDVLMEIRDLLKPKQEIKIIERQIRPEIMEKLLKFKNKITSNEFFNTLTEEQKKIVLKA